MYDWDERVAVPAATLMFEKGVNNVVLLSGGAAQNHTCYGMTVAVGQNCCCSRISVFNNCMQAFLHGECDQLTQRGTTQG